MTLALLLFAEISTFFYIGPMNTEIINSVPPSIRARALSINTLLIHFLGDAISPPIVGAISDRFGLQIALSIAPVFIFLAFITWGLGFCFIKKQENLNIQEISEVKKDETDQTKTPLLTDIA